VVNDEPAGRSQAPGSQAGTVAVAGQDEQPGAFGRGDRDQGIPARHQRIGSAAAMVKTARVI